MSHRAGTVLNPEARAGAWMPGRNSWSARVEPKTVELAVREGS